MELCMGCTSSSLLALTQHLHDEPVKASSMSNTSSNSLAERYKKS